MAVAALTGTIIGLTGRGEVIARRRLVKYWRSDLAPPIFLGLALHRWRFTAKYGVRITPNRRASKYNPALLVIEEAHRPVVHLCYADTLWRYKFSRYDRWIVPVLIRRKLRDFVSDTVVQKKPHGSRNVEQ